MPSDYVAFDVLIDNNDGTTSPAANATVHVFDITNDAALADILADASGHVAAGTLAVDAGTEIRFSVEGRADGRNGHAEQITS